MNVVHGKTKLHKPVHDLNFCKVLSFAFLFTNMESQVSVFTVFHDDDQDTLLNEGVFVGDDVRMVQFS